MSVGAASISFISFMLVENVDINPQLVITKISDVWQIVCQAALTY